MSARVDELQQELATFPGREEGLRTIGRYRMYGTMFYRSSDYSHSKRIAWLVEAVEPVLTEKFGDAFDMKRALVLALVHDDAELITGDHQAAEKSAMSKEALAALDGEEMRATEALSKKFPRTLGGYVYREMLEDMMEKNSKEAQVAKFLDRFDAQGEAWHEMFGGNTCITTRVKNGYGELPLPFELYARLLPDMLRSYEYMNMLAGSHPFFSAPEHMDWSAIAAVSRPHTQESLPIPTGHLQYDMWKQVVLDSGDAEEVANLYTQKEFLVDQPKAVQ